MTVSSDTDRPEIISSAPLRVCGSYKSGRFSCCLPHGTDQSVADRLCCQLKAQEPPVMQAYTHAPTHQCHQQYLIQLNQLHLVNYFQSTYAWNEPSLLYCTAHTFVTVYLQL